MSEEIHTIHEADVGILFLVTSVISSKSQVVFLGQVTPPKPNLFKKYDNEFNYFNNHP